MFKMLKRIFLVSIAIALLALFIHAQQQRSGKRAKRSSRNRTTSKRKPARPPVTSFVSDSGGGELIVRLLDVGQGDASYIRNGSTRVFIGGGPATVSFGCDLDFLWLNDPRID